MSLFDEFYEQPPSIDSKVEYIQNYLPLGFKKVCSVRSTWKNNFWEYTHIDKSVMYDDHRSWVYMITRFGKVVKIGETGNFLGIEMMDGQPMLGSKCRLGRYRRGDTSDAVVRNYLRNETQNKTYPHAVEIYAFKCPEVDVPFKIVDEHTIIKSQIHKQLEKSLLDYFKKNTGYYPECNTGRC